MAVCAADGFVPEGHQPRVFGPVLGKMIGFGSVAEQTANWYSSTEAGLYSKQARAGRSVSRLGWHCKTCPIANQSGSFWIAKKKLSLFVTFEPSWQRIEGHYLAMQSALPSVPREKEKTLKKNLCNLCHLLWLPWRQIYLRRWSRYAGAFLNFQMRICLASAKNNHCQNKKRPRWFRERSFLVATGGLEPPTQRL